MTSMQTQSAQTQCPSSKMVPQSAIFGWVGYHPRYSRNDPVPPCPFLVLSAAKTRGGGVTCFSPPPPADFLCLRDSKEGSRFFAHPLFCYNSLRRCPEQSSVPSGTPCPGGQWEMKTNFQGWEWERLQLATLRSCKKFWPVFVKSPQVL